ncbi:cell adhesion molecule-like protein [Leptotrombidium deliense]|uniref:Cell adhesion molecule-like protein n=1 Tax=Leptotrombidium deliense TaxID=299467 RepID=A0A443RSS1_9ACAR|nr:cell adhesion molecule-like protein [Leptotrombidium deliense]
MQWKKQKDNWETNSFKHEFTANSEQFAIDNLRPLETYNFRVFAVNAIGESDTSSVITATTDEEIPGSRDVIFIRNQKNIFYLYIEKK